VSWLIIFQTWSFSSDASVTVADIAAFTSAEVAVRRLHTHRVLIAVDVVLFALVHVYRYGVY